MQDMELVRHYAQNESESAFAELVRRYLNLVYSAALRQVRDPSLAEEVAQAVFIVLARKSRKLPANTVLSGWLLTATRYAASNQIRAAMRRTQREQEAFMQSSLDESAIMAWEQLAPLLDEAMASLNETDRNVIALRYFENKTAVEIATALHLTENTAQKRVSRALEKLRKNFNKRGLTVTTALIVGAVSANSVQAAPIGLAATISATAVKGSAVTTSTLTLVKGALKIMAWTKAKTAVVTGVVLLLAAGTTTVVVKESHRQSPPATDEAAIQQKRVAEAQFKQDSIQRITEGKDWAMTFLMYADAHHGQYPKTLAVVKAGNYVKDLSETNWEVVSSGQQRDFKNPAQTILLRDKEPRQAPDGSYFKAYAFVDGHSELARSTNDDFETLERERGFLSQPAGQ